MQFVDSIEINVRAGDGGAGLISFMAAKGKPKLGPDGGDGGFGGDVILVANAQLNTLSALRYHRVYKAEDGERGGPVNRTGRSGEDLRINVPVGTVVHNMETGDVLGELLKDSQEFIVAKGGKRGIGNARFVSSIFQAPFVNTPGGKGEQFGVRLELKLVADVGFAGFPNAGKSTLLSRITNARPKIADYPFTTLVPNLGIVDFRDDGDYSGRGFIACDVPGLIEGASEGKGLGLAFLRHLERTRAIAYVIDAFPVPDYPQFVDDISEEGSSEESVIETCAIDYGQVALESFEKLHHELTSYSPQLAAKPAVVILNKVDMVPDALDVEAAVAAAAMPFRERGIEVVAISALRGDQLSKLKWQLFDLVQRCPVEPGPSVH